jgi:hypothetical protein
LRTGGEELDRRANGIEADVTKANDLEVFQDLALRGPAERRNALRLALAERASAPWRHAADRERDLSAVAREQDVMAFDRAGGDDVDAVGLVLWANEGGYEVTNIVPLEVSELGPRRYNAALQDFAERVARPAADDTGFTLFVSVATQGLDDWLAPEAANALRRFSAAANKATGSSHPMDRRRWFAFLIAVHADGGELDTDRLSRWLVEVEGWTDDAAHDLVVEYEFGLALLDEYDSARA